MATYEVSEYDIDINSKHFINATSGGYGLDDQDKPRLYADEKVVWALNCYQRTLAPTAFAESDTWELWADIDYDHSLYEGTLQSALTTAAATTSIVINYTEAPAANTIGDTGALLLRDDNGNRERVAYTAVTGEATTQATYTINSVTLANPYEAGDYAANEDPLMVGSADSAFNVAGDWANLSVVNGRISVQVDCTAWEFHKKVQAYYESNPSATEVPIWVQINKYASGLSTPSVILQDRIYAKPSVRDIESAAAVSTQNWTLADARYLKVYNNYSTTTEAVGASDLINMHRSATSGVVKFTASQMAKYVAGGMFVQSDIATDSVAYNDMVVAFNSSTTDAETFTRAKFFRELVTADATTERTLALADESVSIHKSNASANDTILPLNASVAFPVNGWVEVVNEGTTAACTIKATTTGVTLNGVAGGTGTVSKWGRAKVVKRSADVWVATGDFTTT